MLSQFRGWHGQEDSNPRLRYVRLSRPGTSCENDAVGAAGAHMSRPDPGETGQLRAIIEASDWLTVVCLPPYAPNLNPVEGIWFLLRRSSQANTHFTSPDHLMRALRHGLRTIQYRPDPITACLTAERSSSRHFSGHYWPYNADGYMPLEDVARTVFSRHGVDMSGAKWDYFNRFESGRD
ncbi:transposase [Actinomadura logoneensis]|uniref:transposase n=1 Tax=Actinomadura logoneensis TaxID=2293572 RepID=UPI001314FEAF|nr:transposase [Actinomadura logoneensis]